MSPERLGGIGVLLDDELDRARLAGDAGQTVILVEGASDLRAVATLAGRLGRDLDREEVAIVAIAGATNAPRFLDMLGPSGYDVPLSGLCDAGEEAGLRHALRLAGVGTPRTRADMEDLGFFVCVRDLEDELVRAIGAERMLDLMESQGHIRRFRSFQNQPTQREKTVEAQIWRWLGNHKITYATLMVEALDLDEMPAPLLRLLSRT